LAELSAIKKHPIEKQTYQKLWQAFQSKKDFVLNQYNIEKLLNNSSQ
jgi:hypothetical protein